MAVVAVTAVPGQWPAQAHHEPVIQPGAAAWPAHTPLGQWGPCTLNFVFRDARHTYIGTAARCTYEVGERVTMADREFGTVVFLAYSGPDDFGPAAVSDPASYDDFALIRVDPSEVHRVSPVVLDIGRAPHGVTTSDMTSEGNLLFMTGQGAGVSQRPTRHRVGVLVSDDSQGFRAGIPVTLGDAGAPVLDGSNYNAYGVATSISAYGGSSGTTVERILELLGRAGFRVDLVTAWDERVRLGQR